MHMLIQLLGNSIGEKGDAALAEACFRHIFFTPKTLDASRSKGQSLVLRAGKKLKIIIIIIVMVIVIIMLVIVIVIGTRQGKTRQDKTREDVFGSSPHVTRFLWTPVCFSVGYSTWGNSFCLSIPPGGIGLRLPLSSYFAALWGSRGNLETIFGIILLFFGGPEVSITLLLTWMDQWMDGCMDGVSIEYRVIDNGVIDDAANKK